MAQTKIKLNEVAKTVNEDILDKSVLHAVYLERFKASEIKSIISFFNGGLVPDLLTQVEKNLNKGTVTEKRIREMAVACNALCNGAYHNMRELFEEDLTDLAVTEAQWQTAMMKAAVPIDFNFVTPDLESMRKLVDKSLVHGKYVKDWFSELSTKTAANVTQQIRLGIAEGQSVTDIVRRIRGTKALNYSDGILQESRRNLSTIIRTSASSISNGSRNTVYNANSDIVKGYQFVATLDARTTETCMSLDGKVFSLDEGPIPPMHHNCRSTTVPVMKSWKELGINLEEAPASTRASMNGQVAEKVTYGKWLKAQPVHIQNEALGKTKAELFRTGKVKIEKFVNQQNRPLTLEQLRVKEGLSLEDVEIKRLGVTKSGDIKGSVRQWVDKNITSEELTKAQTNAMLEYQQGTFGSDVGGYTAIQRYLRFGETRINGVQRSKKAIKAVVRDIDNAIEHSTLNRSLNLYRGVQEYPTVLGLKDLKDLKTGFIFTDKGFVSSSPRITKANKYALVGNNYSAMFRIRAKKGQNLFYVNQVGQMHEEEFLLPRKTKFKVAGIGTHKTSGREMPLITLEIE